jgi:hypothetical protein
VPNDDDVRLHDIARELKRLDAPVRVSESFDARVMAEIRQLPRHRRFTLWTRLTTPRTITFRPLTSGLLAASLTMFAAVGVAQAWQQLHRVAKPMTAALFQPKAKPVKSEPVQFVLVAPDAKKVAVVGDFNGWDASHAAYQAHHRGGGVWSVTAPVPVGHHRYSFVVDDSVWVADPIAPRVVDNDYGMPNSAIVVEEQK